MVLILRTISILVKCSPQVSCFLNKQFQMSYHAIIIICTIYLHIFISVSLSLQNCRVCVLAGVTELIDIDINNIVLAKTVIFKFNFFKKENNYAFIYYYVFFWIYLQSSRKFVGLFKDTFSSTTKKKNTKNQFHIIKRKEID